jgi:signal transduction histidine kinase
MRKYIFLTIVSIFVASFLFYLCTHSESHLEQSHQEILNVLLNAKQAEATLDKNLLKSRNFLISSYDPIVESQQKVSQLCGEFKNSLYGKLGADLDNSINEYCEAVERKLQSVEVFKSQNSVFRNSLLFIHKIASDKKNYFSASSSQISSLYQNLITASLAYSVIPNDESKALLNAALKHSDVFLKKTISNSEQTEDLAEIAAHARKIMITNEILDSLIDKQVVNSKTTSLLEKINRIYFQSYENSEANANIYRHLLYSVCAGFFILIIYNIMSLWKAAQKLSFANANLEMRVNERTRDLQQSQLKIVQQQQALMTSAKLSALGEMAGGVAHEINNPLAIIQMRVEQLGRSVKSGKIDPEFALKVVDIISKTTVRISKIVNGLRSFARDGTADPMNNILVQALIADTLSLCHEKFANHGVQIEIFMDNALKKTLDIECRSTEICQVLVNLLNNSYDAIEHLPEKWIHLNVTNIGDYIELSVTDCGSGIPKDIQEKMMNPFFTTKEIGKGTGLGLSISKGIVTSHQGKIFIDNSCKNTKITVILPKKQALAPSVSAKESA